MELRVIATPTIVPSKASRSQANLPARGGMLSRRKAKVFGILSRHGPHWDTSLQPSRWGYGRTAHCLWYRATKDHIAAGCVVEVIRLVGCAMKQV